MAAAPSAAIVPSPEPPERAPGPRRQSYQRPRMETEWFRGPPPTVNTSSSTLGPLAPSSLLGRPTTEPSLDRPPIACARPGNRVDLRVEQTQELGGIGRVDSVVA